MNLSHGEMFVYFRPVRTFNNLIFHVWIYTYVKLYVLMFEHVLKSFI
jgi:hypothetical protein